MDTQAYISSGVIEAYVMGFATEEEIQILECIQTHNSEVKQAILDAQKAMEDLVTQQAVAPPLHLKKNIWAAIQEEEIKNTAEVTPILEKEATIETKSQLQPVVPNQFVVKRYYKSLSIAASVSLIVGLGAVLYLYQKQETLQNQIAQMEQKSTEENNNYNQLLKKWDISSNPDMKTVILAGVENHPGMKAMVYIDKSTKQTYLSVENLPACPAGHAYQLWAIVDGKPVDGGMYVSSKDSIQKMYIIENAQAFAITLEKEGGSVSPTMEKMYVMGAV